MRSAMHSMSQQRWSPERGLPAHPAQRLGHPAAFHLVAVDLALRPAVDLARPVVVALEPDFPARPPRAVHLAAEVAVRAAAEVEQTQSAQ